MIETIHPARKPRNAGGSSNACGREEVTGAYQSPMALPIIAPKGDRVHAPTMPPRRPRKTSRRNGDFVLLCAHEWTDSSLDSDVCTFDPLAATAVHTRFL